MLPPLATPSPRPGGHTPRHGRRLSEDAGGSRRVAEDGGVPGIQGLHEREAPRLGRAEVPYL